MKKIEIAKLIAIQKDISKKVIFKSYHLPEKFKIAAFDISFKKDEAFGICIVINEKKEIIEKHSIKKAIEFPYIPTFLAFREMPIILELYSMIKNNIDLVLIDGNGLIHPRKCGIAVHFGVEIKKPTIGVAKSYLYGIYTEPENKKFNYSYVYHEDGSILGFALRSKENTKPIFISPGNLIDLNSSLEIIKNFINKHRIPEPLMIAHKKTQSQM